MNKLISLLKHEAINSEWGSDKQINAENGYFSLTGYIFGIDWEEHTYLMKATTEEMIEYAELVINKRGEL